MHTPPLPPGPPRSRRLPPGLVPGESPPGRRTGARRPARFLLLSGLALLVAACGDADPRTRGTVEMAERLDALAREVEAREHPYAMSHGGADDESHGGTAPEGSVEARARAGRAALRDGRTDEAVATLYALLQDISASSDPVPPALRLAVVETAGLAHLRRWTEENCVAPVATAACTFPGLRPAGAREEARRALQIYRSLQEGLPDNLSVRWLLNLSALMAGDYPAAVPGALRLPPAAVPPAGPSEAPAGPAAATDQPGAPAGPAPPASAFPAWSDVAPSLGVDVPGHAGGAVLEDLDGDGDLDLAVSSWHLRDPVRIFRNDGSGAGADGSGTAGEGAAGDAGPVFTDVTEAAGLAGITGGLNLVQADYDNDGLPDLLVLRGAWTDYGEPNSLLRNRGEMVFEDVTESAGLLDAFPTQAGAWADFDGDGWLDLFVGNESPGERVIRSQLFRNNGDGTFTDVAAEVGADVTGFVKGAAWGDVDNDGRPDLYVSRLNEPNVLLRNLGVGAATGGGPGAGGPALPRFRDVTGEAGVSEPLASFPTWFWDYDNDGWLDLFVSGYRGTLGDVMAEYLGRPHAGETPRLYRNRGDGTFENVTARAGLERVLLTMGSNFGDLDNDGLLDFYVGTGEANLQTVVPNRMFRNRGDAGFVEVTAPGGFGHLGKGHGVAFGDVDGDGDQDVYTTMGGAYPSDVARNLLFRNPGGEHGWLTLRLEGRTSNRSAVGARVRVEVETPGGDLREIHRVVGTGSSFGANSLAVEVGLGDAAAVRAVEVRWPAGGVERFTGVEVNAAYRVVEGTGRPERRR